MAVALKLRNISKNFGPLEVFDNFNYSFHSNSLYKLSGPNGSGKTTLFKIIKGIYLPDNGLIESNNTLNITYIDNNPRSFFHRLNLNDNLNYFLSLNKNLGTHTIEELLDYFEISAYKTSLFSSLSQGQMQLASIIRGLSCLSDILLLDESFSFLDDSTKSKLESLLIKKNNEDNTLIIFSSHDDQTFSETSFIEIKL